MKLAKECLGEYLKEASPSLVGLERKIWATLEAFDWPEEYANVQESLVRYYAQNPEEYRAALARDEHLVSWPTCPKTHLRSFWSGLLDPADAVLVVVGIEVILFATAVGEVVLVVRHYRRGLTAGLNLWAALEEGLAVLLPRKAARIAALEPHLWVCVLRWISRRTVTPDREFSYHKRSQMGLIIVMVAFTTPVELLVLELRAPRVCLRISVLVLGVYALHWIFGLYAPLPGHAPPPPRRERPAAALWRVGRGLRPSLGIAARPSSAPSVERSDRATVFRRIPKTAGSTWPWAAKLTSP